MIIEIIILTIGLYLLCGFLFAVPFVIRGVKVIDEGAEGTKWGFRLVIVPGSIIFWPLLLNKWLKSLKKKQND